MGLIDKSAVIAEVDKRIKETEGRQKFTASNLGELYMKIMEFCKSL